MALRETFERLDDTGIVLLEAEMAHVLQPEEDLTEASQRLHNLLAELSGNTVLQLFIPTMTALVQEMWDLPRKPVSARTRATTWAGVASTHNEIIAAILRKDVDLAADLLQSHLEVVTRSLRARKRRVQMKEH
jgi:DNA-binding FadR family transcriptional regulator